MNKKHQPSQGRMLISEPSLRDFYFAKSLVLLLEHGEEEGTFGLILNKPIHLKIKDVVKDFPNNDFPLYLGGPVNPDRLFYLHTVGEKLTGSIKIFDDLYWGGDINQLMNMIDLKLVGQQEVKFFIGYSGWESRQLDREIGEKSWIVTQGSKELSLSSNPEGLWSNIIKKLGNDYAIWANFPPDPILN